MTLAAFVKTATLAAADPLPASAGKAGKLLHLFFSFGVFGVFFISIVDSSFVPLPIPGVTDIMIVLLAAQHTNPFLLVGLATLGSALGGFFSHQVGQHGGMQFLENHVPKRIFKRVCTWMNNHAILAVALPALLPPPMPLSPFVLAAGALNMERRKFMITFTLSRLVRHAIAAWLGIRYGAWILSLYARFSQKWAEPVLIVLWTGILLSVGYALFKLFRTTRNVRATSRRDVARTGV